MTIVDRLLERVPRPVVTIESMRTRHLPAVLEIEQGAYSRGWSEQIFRDELAEARRGRRSYLVARRGKQVLGYAGAMFTGGDPEGEAHITNVAVHSDARRTGVATTLLVALGRVAIAAGCPAWTLEVRATSTGAHELYRRFGFAPAGVRPGYYENGVDAIIMWCHELQSPAYAELLARLDRRRGTP